MGKGLALQLGRVDVLCCAKTKAAALVYYENQVGAINIPVTRICAYSLLHHAKQ